MLTPFARISRRRVVFFFLLLFCASCLRGPAAEAAESPESMLESYERQRRAMADRMERGTVWVLVDSPDSYSMGSGFVVADGFIMTNAHVVNKKGSGFEIYVMNASLPRTKAKVVAMDHDSRAGADFALLRFAPPKGVSLPVFAFNLDARRMDRVSAWGYPGMVTQFDSSIKALNSGSSSFSAPPVVYTEGTVSTLVEDGRAKAIIHTAPIAGGNSGGPLVNSRGEVLGVNTWGYKEEDEGAFVNAALPAERAVVFLRRNGVTPLVSDAARLSDLMAEASPPRPGREEGGTPAKTPSPQPSDPARGVAGAIGGIMGQSQGQGGAPAKTPSPGADPALGVAGAIGGVVGSAQGQDPRVTLPEAKEYLSLAAAGNADAMAAVGAMYLDGSDGFPEDIRKALFWLGKGAESGNSLAKGLLGFLYLLEDSLRDPAKGLVLLQESASAKDGDADVRAFLSTVLFEGDAYGVASDEKASLYWAQKAAAGGSATGKAVLALHYYTGAAVAEDTVRALALAGEAAASGDEKGKAVLAFIRFCEADDDTTPESLMALALEAANAGEGYAQGLLAVIHAFEKGRADAVAAERWARLAAGQANFMGQYVLGWLYMKGIVVEKNDALAWAYLDLAAKHMDDLEVDEGGPLLQQVEKRMRPEDRQKAKQIQQSWFDAWGRPAGK